MQKTKNIIAGSIAKAGKHREMSAKAKILMRIIYL
jgi:hypothetical protein